MVRSVVVILVLCTCKAPAAAPGPARAPEPVAVAVAPAEAVAEAVAEPVAAPAVEARCVCPSGGASAGAGDEASAEVEPERAHARRARAGKKIAAALAARLRAALPEVRAACDVAGSGPCSLGGDLDGDGLGDAVVLVRGPDGAGGLAVLWGRGEAELLGAGRAGACWTPSEVPDVDAAPGEEGAPPCPEEVGRAIEWIEGWALHRRETGPAGPVFAGKRATPAPGAVGDGLWLSGGDAAAILYRTQAGWTLMGLGY